MGSPCSSPPTTWDEAERCDRLAYLAYGNLLTRGTLAEDPRHPRSSPPGPSPARTCAPSPGPCTGQPGVEQVVAFGNALHVSGRDRTQLETAIAAVRDPRHEWRKIPAGLEDVFISLMDEAKDNYT